MMLNYITEVALTVAVTIIGMLLKTLIKEIKQQKTERQAIKDLLKSQLIVMHMRCTERGSISLYTLEEVSTMYQAYKTMGGNGTIQKLVEEVMKLPVKKG